MQPGSELRATDRLYAGTPYPASVSWFKYVVYNNASWDPSSYTTTDAYMAEKLNPADIKTYPSSLPLFEQKGGKILMYHGQQDNQITGFNSNLFYEHLRRGSSSSNSRSYTDMHSWIRLFRISGMFHCSGGPGAWVLGQGGNAATKGVPFEADNNVLAALVRWVEEGVAPEYVQGTKFVGDEVGKGVNFTRRHCLYPKRNTFVGGKYEEPGSWRCV